VFRDSPRTALRVWPSRRGVDRQAVRDLRLSGLPGLPNDMTIAATIRVYELLRCRCGRVFKAQSGRAGRPKKHCSETCRYAARDESRKTGEISGNNKLHEAPAIA